MRFYDPKTQQRVDSIPKKSGNGTKAPNITDAISMGLVPSVTEICNVVAKPMLLTWLQQQAFDSAWGSAATPMPKDEAWAYYQQQSAIARDRGSLLHDRMSRLEECPETKATLDWINAQNYIRTEHEVQFATEKYGGTIDFIGYATEGSDDYMAQVDILDFKFVTKERQPHDSELWQLAAYRGAIHDLGYAIRNVYNLYISQETGQLFNVHRWSNSDIISGYHTFDQALRMWESINNYRIGHGKMFSL